MRISVLSSSAACRVEKFSPAGTCKHFLAREGSSAFACLIHFLGVSGWGTQSCTHRDKEASRTRSLAVTGPCLFFLRVCPRSRLGRRIGQFCIKLIIHLLYDPESYSYVFIQEKWKCMFTQKPVCECPWHDEWIFNLWYVHLIEYFSATKRSKLFMCAKL